MIAVRCSFCVDVETSGVFMAECLLDIDTESARKYTDVEAWKKDNPDGTGTLNVTDFPAPAFSECD